MSEVILLEPLPAAALLPAALARQLEGLLRRCFNARRKMLRNSLAGLLPPGELDAVARAAAVDLSLRPQDLSLERWLDLEAALPWTSVPPASALAAEDGKPGCPDSD